MPNVSNKNDPKQKDGRLFTEDYYKGKPIRRITNSDLKNTGWNIGNYLVCYCPICQCQRHHRFLFAVYSCTKCEEVDNEI